VELFLNFLWFVLATGALSALLHARRRNAQSGRGFLVALFALVCAAALLFPAISITDDLHFNAFVVEDSSATKRLVNAIAQAAPIVAVEWFGFALSAFLLTLRQRKWHVVASTSIPYKAPLLTRPALGRAPPVVFCA
jgi:hypothetical protein